MAIWLELSNEQQGDYRVAKEEIEKALKLIDSVSLDDFHWRKCSPEKYCGFSCIDQATLNMAKEAKEPLLLHQFLTGLPGPITRQPRLKDF